MAFSVISKPGSGHGPCAECKHQDCAASRVTAKRHCRLCGKPIGYDTKFVADDANPGQFNNNHWLCAIKGVPK